MGDFQSTEPREPWVSQGCRLEPRGPRTQRSEKEGSWHKKGRRNRECGKRMKRVVSQMQEKRLLKYKELLGCVKHYAGDETHEQKGLHVI